MNPRRIWHAVVYRLCNLIWPLLSLFGTKSKFEFVYRLNLWANPESISGDGSTLGYTENIRKELPLLFRKYGITSIFDAPCGDYNWFRHVDRGSVCYIGGDIVEAMANENQQKFGNNNTCFIEFDICHSKFPDADLWLCRDCMFHLPTSAVLAAFENYAESGIPYVLTTSHVDTDENKELPREGFRMLNLEKPPYNFPTPDAAIEDWIPGYPRRILGLWKQEDVCAAVAKWKTDR